MVCCCARTSMPPAERLTTTFQLLCVCVCRCLFNPLSFCPLLLFPWDILEELTFSCICIVKLMTILVTFLGYTVNRALYFIVDLICFCFFVYRNFAFNHHDVCFVTVRLGRIRSWFTEIYLAKGCYPLRGSLLYWWVYFRVVRFEKWWMYVSSEGCRIWIYQRNRISRLVINEQKESIFGTREEYILTELMKIKRRFKTNNLILLLQVVGILELVRDNV